MSRIKQRAKLLPGLLGDRSPVREGCDSLVAMGADDGSGQRHEASAIRIPSLAIDSDDKSSSAAGAVLAMEPVLFKKGAATASDFRPAYWSYDPNTPDSDPSRDPLQVSIRKSAQTGTSQSALSAEERTHAEGHVAAMETHVRATENQAAQEVLAASLAQIIENVLCTRRFAARRQA